MRLAQLFVVVGLGIGLAFFAPDRRRAPDVEFAFSSKIVRGPGIVMGEDHVECRRTTEDRVFLCDWTVESVEPGGPAELATYRVTTP